MASRLARKQLAAQAQHYGEDAVLFLKSIMYGDDKFVDKGGRTHHLEPNIPTGERMKAANALLDRGYGRPPQAVTLGDEDGDGASLTLNGFTPSDLLARKMLRLVERHAARGRVNGPDAGGTGETDL